MCRECAFLFFPVLSSF
uniref:Uncharacterized protein n=1 Tax=Rhizophora mucronata TaxID=61149 RepID=A0A2P2N914_RHIMU